MPLSYAELEQFYEGLVSRAHSGGITCAITSGMACVAFGVAQATKDCDLRCAPQAARDFFQILGVTRLGGRLPSYRGHFTPPLDSRWLRGGWTSHFVWDTPGLEAYLDIFGIAPRSTSPWEAEFQGSYAGLHTVAEMKRTHRERDWPYATALALLTEADERLEVAVKGEIEFWNRLDQLRMKVYERAVRPYFLAVKSDPRSSAPALAEQHDIRLAHAEQWLPMSPLRQYGIDRLIEEARAQAARFLPPEALRWLPDVAKCFTFLSE